MAKILFNTTFETRDTFFMDNLTPEYIWNQLNFKFRDLFLAENMDTFKINNSFNFRPDKVAYEVYGNDLFYPIILFSNQIGSLMQFRIDILGTEIKYLKPELIKKLEI